MRENIYETGGGWRAGVPDSLSMLRQSRPVAAVLAGLLLVSACGSTATPAADAPELPDITVTAVTPATTVTTSGSEPVQGAPAGSTPVTAPGEQAPIATELAPDPPTVPDEGCSADNSPTTPDLAEGPLPSIEVRAESVGNALPDLAVRRINCAGGWVNLKNEIPASTPLLVWFWAPH
jgi:hypothetical protein